jgi:hypothetical protein
MGDPWANNEEQVRCEASKDREQRRSSAPDDRREPRQDETRRTVDLGHSSDGPSWIDLTEIRVYTTESRFAAGLNRLLQRYPPRTGRFSQGRDWPATDSRRLKCLFISDRRGLMVLVQASAEPRPAPPRPCRAAASRRSRT